LKGLVFSNNEIPVLDGGNFGDLANLKFMGWTKNTIGKIDNNAFAGLKNLKSLYFVENNMELNLNSVIFKDLISLEHLNIDLMKKVKILSPNFLQNQINLISFIFEDKTLSSIPEQTFQSNLEMMYVSIKANLSRIPRKSFSHLKKLETIRLLDNFCISDTIEDHRKSPNFTEDLLLPCSCKPAEKEDSDVLLKNFLTYFGGMAGITLASFIIMLKRRKKKEEFLESGSSLAGRFKRGKHHQLEPDESYILRRSVMFQIETDGVLNVHLVFPEHVRMNKKKYRVC
jgi:hypothetical protein